VKNEISSILDLLREKRGFDFTGYRFDMLRRRIERRIAATQTAGFAGYFAYLKENNEEFDNLIDNLTINVSEFFRDPLIFEMINRYVLSALIQEKILNNDSLLRIWSAGCSFGEEPYSIAILIEEILKKEKLSLDVSIFATDVDASALAKAQAGVYAFDSLKNVKYGLLRKYFTPVDGGYAVNDEIKKMVNFSKHDLTDKSVFVPRASVFGNFDIVLCRNVLIYFEPEYQHYIFDKLFHALNDAAFLVLGESETVPGQYAEKLGKINQCCHIYQKR